MPEGPIVLVILLVLIAAGFFRSALDHLGVHAGTAALVVLTMLIGSLVDLRLAPALAINLGEGLIPLALALCVVVSAKSWGEAARGTALAAGIAGALYLIAHWFPPGSPTELNLLYLDVQYLFDVVAGVLAGLLGRTHRVAFAGAVLGTVGADFLYWAGAAAAPGTVGFLGGTGFHGTAAVAAVLGVLLADWTGAGARTVPRPGALSSRRS